MRAIARVMPIGSLAWKMFRPIETPTAPPERAPSTISRAARSESSFGPPATTTGTGQPRTTSLNVSDASVEHDRGRGAFRDMRHGLADVFEAGGGAGRETVVHRDDQRPAASQDSSQPDFRAD